MTIAFDAGLTLADRMRRHARDSDHLYGHLMRAMARDWEDGGPVREICAGWEDAPSGSVIQLRLLGGLFRIVLTGRAPELEPFYPCLGGTAKPSAAWSVVRDVLAGNVDELQEALSVAPQTNEVGRSNALVAGIFAGVARTDRSRIRLLEPGASAGLNLLVDGFRFVNAGWSFGPSESPVVLTGGVLGDVRPMEFQIVERRGCDLSPIDASTPDGQLRLKSFVWPFHVERHERLSAAFLVAARFRPVVDQAPAGEWLTRLLSQPVTDDVLTVVWQSITRQYWTSEERDRVDEAVRQAQSQSAVVQICMEYARLGEDVRAELTIDWSNGLDSVLHHERLGTVGDHGFPVSLDG